jgi:hypothetical protein
MRIVAVLWPDNTMDVGDDASDILSRVAADQWSHTTPVGMKLALAERAAVWSGARIDVTLSDEEFLDELGRAGVCIVERFEA